MDVDTKTKPAHALMGTIMSGADIIIQVLADEGRRGRSHGVRIGH